MANTKIYANNGDFYINPDEWGEFPPLEPNYTIYECHICHKPITDVDAYCQILHYVPHPSKSTHFNFHEKCFEQIAGKEYM